MIPKLLGIFRNVFAFKGEYISKIFPRAKNSGSVRIILNLSNLNEHKAYGHFKVDNLNSVLLLMEQNCYMGSVDLKDAYYTVNVHHEFRKYLRFEWKNELYEFTCMPNGLSCAPRILNHLANGR